MRIWPVLFLLSCLPAWGCIANEHREFSSGNGQWVYSVFWDDGFRHELRHKGRVVWSRHRGSLPNAGAVADDGSFCAIMEENRNVLIFDRSGREVRDIRVQDPAFNWSFRISVRIEDQELWLGTDRGEVYHCELAGGAIRRCDPIEACRRLHGEGLVELAVRNRLPLSATQIKQLSAASDLPTRQALAAYRLLHGDGAGVHLLKQAYLWSAVTQPDRFDQERSYYYYYSPVMAGVLAEAPYLKRLQAGDSGAAVVLAQVGGERSLPALWKAVEQGSSEAVGAVVCILGERASQGLCARLRSPADSQSSILKYFSEVRYAPVVPELLKLPWNRKVRWALVHQVRQDLGDRPEAWQRWWEEQKGSDRWTNSSNPDRALWAAMRGQDPTAILQGSPRLVGIFAADGAEKMSMSGEVLRLLSGRNAQAAIAWNWRSGKVVLQLPAPVDDRKLYAASGNGETVVVAEPEGVRALRDGVWKWIVRDDRQDLDLSSSGRYLYHNSQLVDFAEDRVQKLSGYTHYIFSSAFDSQERYLWSTPPLALKKGLVPLPPSPDEYHSDPPALSPDGTRLIDSGKLFCLGTHVGPVSVQEERLQWSPDSRHFVGQKGYGDGLGLFERNGKCLHRWENSVEKSRFSPDGRRLAVGCPTDCQVEVWDLASLKVIARVPSRQWIEDLQFSPNGEHLAVLEDGEIRVWELRGRQWIAQDPLLGSQLWSGRRIHSGVSRPLRPPEYAQLLRRWGEESGASWLEILTPEPPFPWEDGLWALLVLALGTTLGWRLKRAQ